MDTGVAGGNMVFVKVRETYDLHTVKNKMTVIGIHTPKPDIIKRNFPGLLMQCKMYRPVSADVRIACASMLPLDPKGVGLTENDVAPEDVFNPILYKAMSNKGMSQLEARINAMLIHNDSSIDVRGSSANVEVDNFTNIADEFNVYYGLLSDQHGWRHAMPQQGLSMSNLRPLVYEMVYNVGDMHTSPAGSEPGDFRAPDAAGVFEVAAPRAILGSSRAMPFIPCTEYTRNSEDTSNTTAQSGFLDVPKNCEVNVPYIPVVVAGIIIPPSRLHELFYRMVVEWTIEFSSIRSLTEITSFTGIREQGQATHYQNYSYEATKEVVTGSPDSMLESDSCMVSSNVDVVQVM